MVLLRMGHDMAWCYCYCDEYSGKSFCKFIYWNSNFYVHSLGGANLNKTVLHILMIIIIGVVTVLIAPILIALLGVVPGLMLTVVVLAFMVYKEESQDL